MRASWATSGKFHESFIVENETSIGEVLEDYGLPSTGQDSTVKPLSEAEDVRVCKFCHIPKRLDNFYAQTKSVAGREVVYYAHDCKECRKERRTKTKEEKTSQQQGIADAPIVAAVRLFHRKPEALALVIKHFRTDFEELYRAELALAEAKM